MHLAIFLLVSLVSLQSFSHARQGQEWEKQILDSLLAPDKYDKNVRPPTPDGPVIVKVNIYVRQMGEINEVTMDYNTQLTFRQKWQDPRLQYDDKGGKVKYLIIVDSSKIWTPDVFFSNEKTGHFHNIVTPNTLIRVYPNGEILYSMRISLSLACHMNLRSFPMDNQLCPLVLASYGYTTEDLEFRWKDVEPIQISKNLNLHQFKLLGHETEYCNSKTNTGEYSCLKLEFSFHRLLSHYLIQVYIPFTMMVLLSWISIWLDYRATTLRLLLWVTNLLAMSFMAFNVNSRLPPVSYTKAVDVWTGMCLTFVFSLAIELVVVSKFAVQEEKVRKQGNAELEAEEMLMKKPLMTIEDGQECGAGRADKKLGRLRTWLKRYQSRAQRVDVVARVCYPLAFAVFNILYWSTYYRIA